GFVLLALREKPALTVETFLARDMMKAHHAVTRPTFRKLRSGRNDGALTFLTEDLRRLNVALEDFLDVGAADAARRDLDQDFVWTDFRHRDFLDADDALVAVTAAPQGVGSC